MKINKKLIVSSLASAMGLSIVGAITGTVAWYQYSTRSTLAMIGVSAKTAANLKIAIVDDTAHYNDSDTVWSSDLKVADVNAYLAAISQNNKLTPVTTGNQARDGALSTLKAHPIYKVFDETKWDNASADSYIVLPLQLKWEGVEEGDAVSGENKKVWVNNALFQEHSTDVNTKGDLSKALRVHLAAGTKYMLLSKDGADTDTTGLLDLNRDGVMDDEHITWSDFDIDPSYTGSAYGAASSKQTAYKIADIKPSVDASGNPSGDKYLGQCNASGILSVTVTIWLEGWQKLDDIKAVKPTSGNPHDLGLYDTPNSEDVTADTTADGTKTYYQKGSASADWNEDLYLNSQFDLGLEFITERL